MNNLKHLLTRPLKPVPTSLVIFAFVVALAGFADATYLTVEHYRGTIPPCSVVSGCEQVLTSEYSAVMGVPVSLVGALYYLVILIGVFAYLEGKREPVLRWTLIFTLVGFLASLWFVWLQVFVIGSFCLYCLGSAASSTVLFITAIVIFARYSPRQGFV